MVIQACTQGYSSKAQPSYSGNPENTSIMLLTLFELWVALDKLVVKLIPLLMEYSPEVPVAIFNCLLLWRAVTIDMLLGITPTIHSWSSQMWQIKTHSQFIIITNPSSCSHASSALKMMQMQSVQNESQIFTANVTDTGVSQMKLMLSHVTTTQTGECEKWEERDSLSVEVHEWPLPNSVYDAAAVVFELSAPITFKMWQSFTFHFLYDICTPTSPQIQSADISNICTYVLPKGPYHGLQSYLLDTQHTSNEGLANQATCHAELTLHEFIAFWGLCSGSFLQWINILCELRACTLTFCDPVVHLLLLQASLEVGKLSADGSRAWHNELKASEFRHALIDELQSLKVSMEANWLEGTMMSMISILVSRLLSSTEDFHVIKGSYKLLQDVQNTTFRWVQEPSKADAPDEKSSHRHQVRIHDMAATCLSTYNVGPDNIIVLLQSPQDLEILVYCSVTVMDNRPISEITWEMTKKVLIEQWSIFGLHTSATCAGKCETVPLDDSSHQTIHLYMLMACLLVNGSPLTRLPDRFLQHPSYITLFGHQVFDVFPTKIPGMEFVAKAIIHHFKMHSRDIVIQSQHEDGDLLELKHPGNLELDIPALLVQDHVHWLNLCTHMIEFRPIERLWEPSGENWLLQFMEDGQSAAQRGQATLFDIQSCTFGMIANTLGPLENSQYLIVTSSMDEVKVELPQFGLSFFIDKDGELHSWNQRGMVVDKDQSTGTMLGLVNQLILHPKDQQTYGDCRVIIPQGNVIVEPSGHHIQVTIHAGPNHNSAA
ncbi:uncharacterized protein BJ212DRAFT_1299561 [Suillus subaureus]|uniref:Uncharacterized protein n=1 Tax=Suillus subaureus TaxID=48587 RepID=A0A9P7EBZ4_9AGAM|nr:uncharacterized protein BJ212DRAFT_1299561 [Suillus subaureus]KAG1816833.1 hypothetical protein BJ212DRAFT_1299561 [Suillus subaureus]